jgi:hypothetical protein
MHNGVIVAICNRGRILSRAKSQEPRAKSQEPRAKSQEPRGKSREPSAYSRLQALPLKLRHCELKRKEYEAARVDVACVSRKAFPAKYKATLLHQLTKIASTSRMTLESHIKMQASCAVNYIREVNFCGNKIW